jgi:hypothetical protein
VDKKSPTQTTDAKYLSENENSGQEQSAQPDPDLDAIWRVAVGLDLGSRSVLEAEVLMWRICNAKSMPRDAIRKALNEEW